MAFEDNTIQPFVRIGNNVTFIVKSTEPKSIYVPASFIKLDEQSDEYIFNSAEI